MFVCKERHSQHGEREQSYDRSDIASDHRHGRNANTAQRNHCTNVDMATTEETDA